MDGKHIRALQSNNVFLVQNLELEPEFLAYLEQDKTLLNTHVEEIMCEKTKGGRAGSFLRIIRRRGPNAMKSFINACVRTGQDHIGDKLDPALSAQLKAIAGVNGGHFGGGGSMIRQESHQHEEEEKEPNFVDEEDANPFIIMDEKSVRKVDLRSSHIQAMINDHKNIYPVRHEKRGRAVIINNEIFHNEKRNRDGTNFDMMNLDQLLQRLGFETFVHNDVTAQEMTEVLAKEAREKDHFEADSFILALFSHGANGEVYGTDFKPVSIENTIKRAFDGRNCPALSGKPKLLIIQACQGTKSTEGVPVADAEAEDEDKEVDALKEAFKKISLGDGDQQDAVPWQYPSRETGAGDASTVQEKGDMIVAYSTVKGYKSWRLPDKGSWFIRTLCKVFMFYAKTHHVIDMLVKVRQVVSQKRTNYTVGGLYVQMPADDNTLTKSWFLFPGYTPPKQ